MNGIKLGPDMVEGCVLINGVRKVIQEIKIASGIVWPLSQEESYSLENAVLHYRNNQGQEYGTYLYPNLSNYAVITADLIKTVGGTVVSTQTVECYPEYSISPTYNEAVTTSGNHIIWDKANYGTEQKSADYISVKGFYLDPSGQQHRTDSFRVDIGANGTNITSYTYQRSFTISISGNIPSDGGQYNFTAESYRKGIGYWTSGEPFEGSYESTISALSYDHQEQIQSISHSTISGTVYGTVKFYPNTSTVNDITYTFSLTGSGSPYNTTYKQDKSIEQIFYIEPEEWSAPQVGGETTITVHSTYSSFTVSSDYFWLGCTKTSDTTVKITADGNFLDGRNGSVKFTPYGGTPVYLYVTQAAFEPELSLSYSTQSDVPTVGNNYTVRVTHNLPYFSVESSDSWLTYEGSTSDSPTDILVKVASNSGGSARTGYLYFKWDSTTLATFTVSQRGATNYLTLTPGESPQHLQSGSMTFTVESSYSSWECEVTSSRTGWTVTPDYSNNTITVSRTTSALVAGVTFEVTSGLLSKTMTVDGVLPQS